MEGRELAWELSRLLVPEWAGQSPSAPLPLLPQCPSPLPLLISLASLLCPQGLTRLGGGSGGQGTGLGAQQAPQAPVSRAIALCSSPTPPGWPLPPATPDLPGLPPMPPGPTQPGWALERGNWLGSSAGSVAPVGQVIALRSSPRSPWRVPPTCLS